MSGASNDPPFWGMEVQMNGIQPLSISGDFEEVIFEAMLFKENIEVFEKDGEYINGLHSHEVLMHENVQIEQAKVNLIEGRMK